MPRFLDSSFTNELKEVTSPKLLSSRKKFSPDGLFSEQIFGPVNNYTCQCGDYYGISGIGQVCKKCGVEIAHSMERRKRFAKITLPVPVVNPIFYDLIVHLGGKQIKKHVDNLMSDDKYVSYIDRAGKCYVAEEDSEKWPSNKFKMVEKTDAIIEVVKAYVDDLGENPQWKMVLDNLDKLILHEVVVLPPDLRPITDFDIKNGQVKTDPINRCYTTILVNKESMRGTIIDINKDRKLFYTYMKLIQKEVNELFTYILTKMSKKEGLIRGNILGKRIDFSGRAIIAPDPTLKLDECSLPYVMILEMYKIEIAKKLIENSKFKFLNEAIDYVEKCIQMKDTSLQAVASTVIKNEVCMINRQPSLHRLSLIGFNTKMNMESVIKIHPLVCPGFNADFDGDQMAVYIPITEKTKDEVREKILSTSNLYNPANYSLVTTPTQDIILGIYVLTNNMVDCSSNIVEYKGTQITESRKIFNECLPANYPVIDAVITKKELIPLLNDINDKYSKEVTANVLDEIKRIGFLYSTLYGCTLSLEGLEIEEFAKIKDEIYSNEDVRKQLEMVSSKSVEEELKKKFKYSYLIDSGARGTWDQARQLVLSRGFISNFSGEIIPTPIKHNLIEGLDTEEFFLSTYGSRKGLLDVAINTGDAGYLSRKLIFACANLQVDSEFDDCGTTDYLVVNVDSEKKARMLILRYYFDPESNQLKYIDKTNYKEIIGKTIFLRSPIYCKSDKICHKCYGELWKVLHSEFAGVIAAQVLGEVILQLVLRTFHSCLRKNTSVYGLNGHNMKAKDLYNHIKSGEDFYTYSCSPTGEIVISKIIDAFAERMDNKIVKVTLDNDESFECTLDHEIQLRDGVYVEAKDLTVGDSLMPIYTRYVTLNKLKDRMQVKHNTEQQNWEYVYRLSANHKDSEIECTELGVSVAHHKDGNRLNDIPPNIKVMHKDAHIGLHGKEMAIENGLKVKQWYAGNLGEGKRVSDAARRTCVENILKIINTRKFPRTSSSYCTVRNSDFTRINKRYPTYDWAVIAHPDLMSGFIDDRPIKSKMQKAVEYKMDKILSIMSERNVDFTFGEFDKINREIYKSNTRGGFTHREIMLKYSPEYLDMLEQVDGEPYVLANSLTKGKLTGKDRERLQCESRLDCVISKMNELDCDMTYTEFERVSDIVYPGLYSKRKLDTLLKTCPDYTSFFVDDRPVLVKKSKEQLRSENTMDKILSYMRENNIEMNLSEFDRVNNLLHPNANARRNRPALLKYSPNYLDSIMFNHKVTNVEFIELEEMEEFYDFTVDSEYHNFPLSSGVFVHNSGVAVIRGENNSDDHSDDFKQMDVVSDMSTASKLLHSKSTDSPHELVENLFKVYSEAKELLHIHLEVVASQLFWVDDNKWRLMKNRERVKPQICSIVAVPEKESWLMGLGFSNPRKNILKGILNDGKYKGVLDKILLGENL